MSHTRNFYVGWIQIGIICFGWKICCCFFISDEWAPFKPSKNQFDPPRQFIVPIGIFPIASNTIYCLIRKKNVDISNTNMLITN